MSISTRRCGCWRCRARSAAHPETGEPIAAGIGRFGPYIKHGTTFASLGADDDVLTIGLNRAVALLAEAERGARRGPQAAARARAPSRGRHGRALSRPLRPLCQPRRRHRLAAARRRSGDIFAGGGACRCSPSAARRAQAGRARPANPPQQEARRRTAAKKAGAGPAKRKTGAARLGEKAWRPVEGAAGLNGEIAPNGFNKESAQQSRPALARRAVGVRWRQPAAVGPREAARAFGLGPADRPALRGMLRAIERPGTGAIRHRRRSPSVERFGSDPDGSPLARPVAWSGSGRPPIVRLVETGTAETLPVGARAAARLVTPRHRRDRRPHHSPARSGGERVVGVFRHGTRAADSGRPPQPDRIHGRSARCRRRRRWRSGRRRGGAGAPARIAARPHRRTAGSGYGAGGDQPADDRRPRHPDRVSASGAGRGGGGAAGRHRGPGRSARPGAGDDRRQRRARFRRRGLGRARRRSGKTPAAGISSSRSPTSPAYVLPGGALDREAERRGNSVYFPDRVVPMLPEALSNELCSLRPGVDRACLAVHLWIDAAGRKRRHRFERAADALGGAADLRRSAGGA